MSSAPPTTADAELSADTGSYQCPYCEARYPHETIARVHVLRSNDDSHVNHNGLMPDVDIIKVDASGNPVDTITRKTQVKPNDVDAEDLPDRFSDPEKRILMTAIYNPHTDTYTDLQKRANSILDFHGYDPVSYNKVRETLQGYLEAREKPPQHQSNGVNTSMPEATETTADDESATQNVASTGDVPSLGEVKHQLQQLEDTQREIIIEWVGQKDPKKTHIADLDHVDVSQSYPGKVIEKYGYLIEDLETALEAEDDIIEDPDYIRGLLESVEAEKPPEPEPEDEAEGESESDDGDDETVELSGRVRRELDRLSPNHQRVIKAIASHPGASDEALAASLDVDEIVVSQLRRKHSNDEATGIIDKLEATYGDAWGFEEADAIEADAAEEEPETESVQDGPTTGATARGMSASPTDLDDFEGTDAEWQSTEDEEVTSSDDGEATEATETATEAEEAETTEATGGDEDAAQTPSDAASETPAPETTSESETETEEEPDVTAEDVADLEVPVELMTGDAVPVEKVEEILGAIRLFKRSAETESKQAQSREAARVLGAMEELETMAEEIIEEAEDSDESPSLEVKSGARSASAD